MLQGWEVFQTKNYYANYAFEKILKNDLGNNVEWNKSLGILKIKQKGTYRMKVFNQFYDTQYSRVAITSVVNNLPGTSNNQTDASKRTLLSDLKGITNQGLYVNTTSNDNCYLDFTFEVKEGNDLSLFIKVMTTDGRSSGLYDTGIDITQSYILLEQIQPMKAISSGGGSGGSIDQASVYAETKKILTNGGNIDFTWNDGGNNATANYDIAEFYNDWARAGNSRLIAGTNLTKVYDSTNKTITLNASGGGGAPSDYDAYKTKVDGNTNDIHQLEDQQYTLNIYSLDNHQTLEKESATTQTKFDDAWFSNYLTQIRANYATTASKTTVFKKVFAAIYFFMSKFKAHEFLTGYENQDGTSGPSNITKIIKECVQAIFPGYYPTLKANEVIWFKWNTVQNVNEPTGKWYDNTSSVSRSLIYLTIQVRNTSTGENKDYGIYYDASKAELFTSNRLFEFKDYANRKVEIDRFNLWIREIDLLKFNEAQNHSTLVNMGFVDRVAQSYSDFSHANGESNAATYEKLEELKKASTPITDAEIVRYLLNNVITGLRKHNRNYYLVENKIDSDKVVHFYEWNANPPFGNIKNGSGTGGTSNTGDYWLQYWDEDPNNDKKWTVYTVCKKGDGSNDYDLTKALRIRITLNNDYKITSDTQWPYDQDWDASSIDGFESKIHPYFVEARKFLIHQTNPGGSGYYTLQEKFMKYDKWTTRQSDWKDFFTKAIHNINDELYGSVV